MKIFCNAGHHLRDLGVIYKDTKESDLAMKIRDEVKKLLPNVLYVSDELDLKESIDWINGIATSEDFAVSIHLNSFNDKSVRGTEAYYWHNPKVAEVFARHISLKLLIPNRGAKPDTQTYVGSLGFLRNLNCPSVLVECAYLSNEEDRKMITSENSIRLAAKGIVMALNELFPQQMINRSIKQLSFLQRLVQWFLSYIKNKN